MKKTIIISLSILVLIFLLALAFFSMPKYCLFSAVDGQVLNAGIPVAGAKVTRDYSSHWFNKEKVTETTLSGKDGRFHFDPAFAPLSFTRFIAWLPHEPVIEQSIVISHEGKDYVAWETFKRNYDTDGELKSWKSVEEKVFVPSRTKSNANSITDVFRGKGVEGDYEIQTKTIESTRPISLACDLTSPDTAKKLDDIVGTTIYGICTLK